MSFWRSELIKVLGRFKTVDKIFDFVTPGDVRNYLDAPPYLASRTALKALDATKDTVAYLTEASREGMFIWDATVPIATHQADTGEKIYVAPKPAAIGAWVRAAAPLTGSPWENLTVNGKTARIVRMSDRLMIADAVNYLGNTVSGASGTWLDTVGAGATKMDYLLINAGFASVTTGYNATTGGSSGYAMLGASRQNGRASGGVIGGAFLGLNDGVTDGVSTGTTVWGGYIEAAVKTTHNRNAAGLEVEITNTAMEFPGQVHPYQGFFTGMTGGMFLGCGGGVGVNPTTFNVHYGIMLGQNGQVGSSSFHKGLVMLDNSLVRDGGTATGRAHAIVLPPNAAVEWYEAATETIGVTVVGNVLDASHRQALIVDDTGLKLTNTGGTPLFWAQWVTNAVNAPALIPSATGTDVFLGFTGTDANGSVSLLGKGTGGVSLRDGANARKIQVNTTGIGFFATTPVAAKTGWGTATGTATRTTFDTTTVTTAQLAERVKALIDDLHQTAGYGLLRT